MKTQQEFRQFYDNVLLPDLEVLEERRLGIVAESPRPSVMSLIRSVVLSTSSDADDDNYCDYSREFKTDIIEKIIHFINKDLTYSMSGQVPVSTFMESNIIPVGGYELYGVHEI